MTDASYVIPYNETHRLIRFITLLPLTSGPERIPVDYRVYIQASVYLAFLALPRREQSSASLPPDAWTLLPDVQKRLHQSCTNVIFDLELYDTQFSNLDAASKLLPLLQGVETTNSASDRESNGESSSLSSNNGALPPPLPPVAMVGAARSAVSLTLASLTSIYRIPQISGSSTASSLDDKVFYSMFGRTVPANDGEAIALVLYLEQFLPNVEYLAVLYFNDDYGSSYHAALLQAAASHPSLSIRSFIYQTDTVEDAIVQLRESGLKYVFAILPSQDYQQVLNTAAEYGLTGEDSVWFFSESMSNIINPSFTLSKETDENLAKALDGTGLIVIDVKPFEAFDEALSIFSDTTTTNDTTPAILRKDFTSRFAEAGMLTNYTFPPAGSTLYHYLAYDALVALSLAACETSSPYFTGTELYEQFLNTEFEGTSGFVSFNRTTGTRKGDTFQFRVVNIVLDEQVSAQDASFFRFQSRTSVLALDLPEKVLELQEPFFFRNGRTTPPLDLPLVDMDQNLIPDAIQIVGWTVSGLLIGFCIFCALWTVKNRDQEVVMAAQPPFLLMLCLGTLIMASSIIPMGLQEPMNVDALSRACMSLPWLLSIGFVTAFSALLSKTLRLNKLFQSSRALRRIQVEAKDVLLPFAILMSFNVLVLLLWTILAPLQWERQLVSNFDSYGRHVESYGTCKFTGEHNYLFVVPICVINFAAILCANYYAYKTRNLPTIFSESGYIFLSIFMMTETFIIGAPLLFIVDDNPSNIFIIRMILVSLWCGSILGPAFIPKYRENSRRLSRTSRPRPVHVYGDNAARPDARTVGTSFFANFFRRSASIGGGGASGGGASGPLSASMQGVGVSRVHRNESYFEDQERRKRNPSFLDHLSFGRQSTLERSTAEQTLRQRPVSSTMEPCY